MSPPKKGRKRLSGYQFFYEACLKEFKVKCPSSTIHLPQVSSICAENWKRVDDDTRKRFQDEADKVNRARVRTKTARKPKRRPAVAKAKSLPLRKCQRKLRKLVKKTSVAKEAEAEVGKKVNTRRPLKPKRQLEGELTEMPKTRLQGKAAKTAKKIPSSKRLSIADKKRIQSEAKAGKKANKRPSREPGQPKESKKTTKKGILDEAKAVKRAIRRNSPKPERLSKNLKKINTAAKERCQKQSKELKKGTVVLKVKRPGSAFIHFSKERRSVVKRNHPDFTFGQISGVLSEMWRNADDKTKMKYKRLSLKQSELYRKEMVSAKLAER